MPLADDRPTLELRTALRSVTGPHRGSNQDSAASGPCFAFVADGVGGHAGGDVASRTVTEVLLARFAGLDLRAATDADLRAALAAANDALAERSLADPALAGLATTFTGLFCAADELRVAHIGDSRGYLVRDGVGDRVSHDDSYVQLLVDTGAIDPADAWQHPQRNLLTQVLAGSPGDATRIRLTRHDARAGDRWLLCSDGLTDYVAEAEVLDLIASGDVEDAADRLIAAALAADARDNVTVAVCDLVETAGPGPTAEPQVTGAASA